MFGFRKWPRPLRAGAIVLASSVVLTGYPIVAVNVAEAAYDIVTLQGCVDGYAQAMQDYKIATDHTPPTGDVKILAAYIVETQRVLEQRVAALLCPRSVQDEQERFVQARKAYRITISGVAKHGLPDNEFAQGIIYQQIEYVGTRAAQATDDMYVALRDEYERQHPEQPQAAS